MRLSMPFGAPAAPGLINRQLLSAQGAYALAGQPGILTYTQVGGTIDPRSLDTTNTGAVLGGTLTTDNRTTISAAGTYQNLYFPNNITVQPPTASTVILFRNCVFGGINSGGISAGGQQVYIPDSPFIPTGISFEYCSFVPGGLSAGLGQSGPVSFNNVAGAFKSMFRCLFVRWGNCINIYDPCTITECYGTNAGLANAGANTFPDTPHWDCIENNGSPGMNVQSCKFINNQPDTSAIMTNNEFGPLNNITINNCYLEGGGYTVYCDSTKSSTNAVQASTFKITNCIIKAGQYGPGAFYNSGVTFGAGCTFL
jgi:hypothetical protein